MDNLIYLLNVRMSGIKSIKNEIRLDFYKKTVDKNFDPDKFRVKAIYGENGSGKTAIITGIKIFQDLMLSNQYLNESKNQRFLDEIINKETSRFTFGCEYITGEEESYIVYDYNFELEKNNKGDYVIKHESLNLKNGNYPNNNYVNVYECDNGELININCNETVKNIIEKKTFNLLNKNPFMSLYIVDYTSVIEKDKEFSYNIAVMLFLIALINVYINEEDKHDIYFLRKTIRESHEKSSEYINDINEILDTISVYSGFDDNSISKSEFDKYKESVKQLTKFIQIFKRELKSIDIDAKDDGDNYRCELIFNYGNYKVNKEFESTGIKKLVRLYSAFKAANNFGIAFVDEMDSNINDIYLCKLIEYFMYYGKGQLCFTMHNVDPMSLLKQNKNSIDFLSSDNKIVSWVSKGHASPENYYKNGMIENSPFNIDATDFIGIFEG
ncbi:MAG TPA: hypothetical protein PLV26_03195 [Lachnospira eligens]|nr:hypothetical protein [Lachnospira eligens]